MKNNLDYNKGKLNLWNITKNKIRYVKEYIDSLEPKSNWELHQFRYFDELKKELQKENESNIILERIGFNPKGRDFIFQEIDRQGVKIK